MRKMIDLSTEQQQFAEIVHNYASVSFRQQRRENPCYYSVAMITWLLLNKRSLVHQKSRWITYASNTYGYYRFAKFMDRLAQGIADGVIDVPKDH